MNGFFDTDLHSVSWTTPHHRDEAGLVIARLQTYRTFGPNLGMRSIRQIISIPAECPQCLVVSMLQSLGAIFPVRGGYIRCWINHARNNTYSELHVKNQYYWSQFERVSLDKIMHCLCFTFYVIFLSIRAFLIKIHNKWQIKWKCVLLTKQYILENVQVTSSYTCICCIMYKHVNIQRCSNFYFQECTLTDISSLWKIQSLETDISMA